ncbi:hypothetical protein 1 [Wenzhou crab virus 5]|uniref:hypothetical protein 1 n=1 Tax=Wenzhou crab virus 5 TaxID=1923562 RepID=UPI00090A3560|nr:hypothetical protein 1 [Wenzhou crab virus 5]APG76065.1 hypothetical protein 1 [Wenzhou crab virus 5]
MEAQSSIVSHAPRGLATADGAARQIPPEEGSNLVNRNEPGEAAKTASKPLTPSEGKGSQPEASKRSPRLGVSGLESSPQGPSGWSAESAHSWAPSVVGEGGAVWVQELPPKAALPPLVVDGVVSEPIEVGNLDVSSLHMTQTQASFIAAHGLNPVSKGQWKRMQARLLSLSQALGPVAYPSGGTGAAFFSSGGVWYLVGVRVTLVIQGTTSKLVPRATLPLPSGYTLDVLHVCALLWLKASLMEGLLQRYVEAGAAGIIGQRPQKPRGSHGHKAVHQGEKLRAKAARAEADNQKEGKRQRFPPPLYMAYRVVKGREAPGAHLLPEDFTILTTLTGYYHAGQITASAVNDCSTVSQVIGLMEKTTSPLSGRESLIQGTAGPGCKAASQSAPSVASVTRSKEGSHPQHIFTTQDVLAGQSAFTPPPPASLSPTKAARTQGECVQQWRETMRVACDTAAVAVPGRERRYLVATVSDHHVQQLGPGAARNAASVFLELSAALTEAADEFEAAERQLAGSHHSPSSSRTGEAGDVDPVWLEWITGRMFTYYRDHEGCIKWSQDGDLLTGTLAALPSMSVVASTSQSCMMQLASALLKKLGYVRTPPTTEFVRCWDEIKAWLSIDEPRS